MNSNLFPNCYIRSLYYFTVHFLLLAKVQMCFNKTEITIKIIIFKLFFVWKSLIGGLSSISYAEFKYATVSLIHSQFLRKPILKQIHIFNFRHLLSLNYENFWNSLRRNLFYGHYKLLNMFTQCWKAKRYPTCMDIFQIILKTHTNWKQLRET